MCLIMHKYIHIYNDIMNANNLLKQVNFIELKMNVKQQNSKSNSIMLLPKTC